MPEGKAVLSWDSGAEGYGGKVRWEFTDLSPDTRRNIMDILDEMDDYLDQHPDHKLTLIVEVPDNG
jgi:hypothetical protein